MRRGLSLWVAAACLSVLAAPWGSNGADEVKKRATDVPEAVRKDALGDPLPPGALLRIGTLRMRHQSAVWGVAFPPDGKTVASISDSPDRCVRVWSAATGEELLRLPVPFSNAWQGNWHGKQVVYSPDGGLLAASVTIEFKDSADLRLWDARTGQVVADLKNGAGRFAFSPDGKVLVSGRGYTVRVWDLVNRKQIREFQVPKRLLEALALSPDGRTVAWAARPGDLAAIKAGCVGVHEVATGNIVWTSQEPDTLKNALNAIAFSPDGSTVAVASREEAVHLLDAKTGRQLGRIGGPTPCLAYSPDGSLLATSSLYPGRMVISLWDTAKRKEARRFACPGGATDLTFSRDGKTLASAGLDRSVRLWEVATGKAMHSWPGHQHHLGSLAYLPDGRTLVSHASDHTVRLWDAGTGKELRRFTLPRPSPSEPRDFGYPGGDRHLQTLAVSPDGKIVAVCDPGQGLYLWETATGKERCLLKGQAVCCVAFAPDGGTLASGEKKPSSHSWDPRLIRLWDPTTGRVKNTFSEPGLWGLLFAPDGQTLVTGHFSIQGEPHDRAPTVCFLRLWDWARGREVGKWHFPPRLPAVTTLTIAPDGRTVALGGLHWQPPAGPPILVGDTRAGVVRRFLKATAEKADGPNVQANGVAFSPDGRLLASAGAQDRSVRIWEVSTGQEVLRFDGHLAGVSSVAFSPDGHRLASGSDDTTILVWNLLGCGRAQLNQARKHPKPLWADLASDNAAWGYRAMSALILAPDQAVDLLAQQLRPIPEGKTRKAAAQLIEEINHQKFAVREAAVRELQARGWEVALELRQALRNPPSADARVRLEKLVANLDDFKPDPEDLRRQRAVQVLERIGTEKARTLLRKLAEGAPWAEQTRDVRAALSRLERR